MIKAGDIIKCSSVNEMVQLADDLVHDGYGVNMAFANLSIEVVDEPGEEK